MCYDVLKFKPKLEDGFNPIVTYHHILGNLKDAQRALDLMEGNRTVKRNLQYLIEDIEQELKFMKEKE